MSHTQNFHDVLSLKVQSTYRQNGNSVTLRLTYHPRHDLAPVGEEIHLFFRSEEAYDALIAVLPKTEDFRAHEDELDG